MSDEKLRELERRWNETGGVEAEAEWLRESLRAGLIRRRRLELVAAAGYLAARNALGLPGVESLEGPMLLTSLTEAIVWCLDRPQKTLKAEELWTPGLCDFQDQDDDSLYTDFGLHELQELETALEQVCSRRRERLQDSGWLPDSFGAASLAGGRIVVADLDATDSCGASQVCSGGLFDAHDVPAWDTWVGLLPGPQGGPLLLAWIPAPLLERAQEGIEVNPMECLWWADNPVTFYHPYQASLSGLPRFEPC